MEDFMKLVRERYSERRFDRSREVESEKLAQLLEAARLAPTACNDQAWRIYVLGGQSGDQTTRAATRSYFHAPLHLLLCAVDDQAWRRSTDGFSTADIDIGIVGTHIVLAAEAQELKSCIICAFDPDVLRKEVPLPAEVRPVMLLAIGYPSERSAPGPRHSVRKSLDELVRSV